MKMKKTFAAVLSTVCALSIVLAGCGSKNEGGAASSSPAGSSPAASQPAGEAVKIRLGHGSAESNSRHKAALKFKELVEQKSNGQISVEVFPSEQLGNEAAMLQSVQSNMIQMTAVGSGIYTKNNPQMGITDLPYAFDSLDQAWKVFDGQFGKDLAEPLIGQGVRILSYWENGFRHVTNNKKPIVTPEDLKGLKIRVSQIPLHISLFKTFGSNPTPMAFGELFQALEQGIVDGQENPLTNIYNSKFYEVQKYLSMTGHVYSPLPLSISEKFWTTLTPDQQKIIQDAATEAGQFHRDTVKADDGKLKDELAKEGMQVNDVDTAPFKAAAQPLYAEAEKEFGKDLLDNFKKALEESK